MDFILFHMSLRLMCEAKNKQDDATIKSLFASADGTEAIWAF
jgi:hypothetical protein